MKVTIIPKDGFVAVDGVGYSEIDLSFLDDDIHAVQWYDTEGEIERQDSRGRITANEVISDITPFQPAIDLWQVTNIAAIEEASQRLNELDSLKNEPVALKE